LKTKEYELGALILTQEPKKTVAKNPEKRLQQWAKTGSIKSQSRRKVILESAVDFAF
jgi:hypothetical protein